MGLCSCVSLFTPRNRGGARARLGAARPLKMAARASASQRRSKWLLELAKSRSGARRPGCAHACLLWNSSAMLVRIFWFPPLLRRTLRNVRRGVVCLCAIQRYVFLFSEEIHILKSGSATFHANPQRLVLLCVAGRLQKAKRTPCWILSHLMQLATCLPRHLSS